MKQVRVQDAIGMVLCHDITEIVPGVVKDAAFRKGHIIEEKDVEKLLDLGKAHIFVYDLEEGYVHENDAAARMIKAACGKGLRFSEVKEGKINLYADYRGVLKVYLDTLYEVTENPEICFATIHGNKVVEEGTMVAGTRVIPLVIKEEALEAFEKVCQKKGPIVEVLPIKPARIGIVTTGSEIKTGRIEDKFGPVLRKKAENLGAEVIGQVFPGDDKEAITKAILDFIDQGVDMVQVSGGMSVDPDDMTPAAIRACGGEVVTYGAPVLPGAMFMLSYVKDVPVVGLPGCVMYAKRTVFDLTIPRILAGERLTRRDFVHLAHGGQCQNCKVCTFPNCGFGE